MYLELCIVTNIYIYKYAHKKSVISEVIRASHLTIKKIQEQN